MKVTGNSGCCFWCFGITLKKFQIFNEGQIPSKQENICHKHRTNIYRAKLAACSLLSPLPNWSWKDKDKRHKKTANKAVTELLIWRVPTCRQLRHSPSQAQKARCGQFSVIGGSLTDSLVYSIQCESTVHTEMQMMSKNQNNFEKHTHRVGIITLPDLKSYYKAIIIKIMWYWCQNKQIY